MKRIIMLLSSFICIFALASCNFNAPLRNKMLDYYSQEENYLQLNGRIMSLQYNEGNDELFLEIELNGDNHSFPTNAETGYGEFALVSWSMYDFSLQENDVVAFSSAPMYFYNGHVLPIVQLEKNGQEYLSLTAGINRYTEWIKNKFK